MKRGTHRNFLIALGCWLAMPLMEVAAPVEAHAAAAENYVKGLIGKWRGGGTVEVSARGRKMRLRCVTTNALRKSTRTLTMRGRCATSSGTRSLTGSIRYSSDGKRITSVSMRMAGRTSSGGSFRGGKLFVTGSGRDEDTGRTIAGRSIISGGGRAYSVTIQSRPNSKWKTSGVLSFRK